MPTLNDDKTVQAQSRSRKPAVFVARVLDRLLLLLWPALLAWAYLMTGIAGGHGAMLVGHIIEQWRAALPGLLLLVIVPGISCFISLAMLLFTRVESRRTCALALALATFAAMLLIVLLFTESASFTLMTGKRLITVMCLATVHLALRVYFTRAVTV